MSKYMIERIIGREVLDSRGNPTVEAEVVLEGGHRGRASVPSGASTGSFEATELRDGTERYQGKGVQKAVDSINREIEALLRGQAATNQKKIDEMLILADGTENKSRLGANSMLAVSLATARAAANALSIPLFRYLGGSHAVTLPIPMMNVINGGAHADSSLNVQEFMIIPVGALTFSEALEHGVRVYHTLKKLLASEGYETSVGDEGGFAPKFESEEQALSFLVRAVTEAGFTPGVDFVLALDAAATEFYEAAKATSHEGEYLLWKSGERRTTEQMIQYWEELCAKYPIVSIEDGLAEEDWDGWKELTKRLGSKIQLVGDDLFVTNPKRIMKGMEENASNAVLIKLNQIGTLSETIQAIMLTKRRGWAAIVSHRSGETEDTFISELSVAMQTGQIKTGAPARTERTVKYNELLRIAEQLGRYAYYPGMEAFKNR